MTIELPVNIRRTLKLLAEQAAGYGNNLKWNEVDMLKSDLMINRSKWTGFSPDQVRNKCLDYGMTGKDARQIAELVERAQDGRRLVPSSSYKGYTFQHDTSPIEEDSEPEWSKYPTAITSSFPTCRDKAEHQAIEWAANIQSTLGGTALIVTPLKGTLDNMNGPLKRLLAQKRARFASVRGGLSIRETDIVIAFCLTKEAIDDLGSGTLPLALCVIPWTDKSVRDWVRRESPQLLGESWQAPKRRL